MTGKEIENFKRREGEHQMWKIKDLKSRAIDVLKQSYWKAFLVSLVLAIVGGNQGASFNLNWNVNSSDFTALWGSVGPGFDFPPVLIAIFIVAICFGILLLLAFRIFVGYPLEVGSRKYFVEGQQYIFDLNHLGYAFNKTRYLDIIKAMFWRGFLNFLWFLLLIIPGIIALYAYRMVPFILTDNPNIGYKRAVQLSTQMTRGHKFHIFLLDLSFLGWLILGILALFIGVLFVLPYINAANAELYALLRQYFLEKGLCTNEKLLL